MEIISDVFMWPVLKYPTGKKDGNKLGKRKRNMKINTALLVNGELHVNPSDYERVKCAIVGNGKFPDISVTAMKTQSPSCLHAMPALKIEEPETNNPFMYTPMWGMSVLRQPDFAVVNPNAICNISLL